MRCHVTQPWVRRADTTKEGKIKYIHLEPNVASSQALVIKLENDPDLCTAQRIDFASMKETDALFNQVVQLLLTAISTQLRVRVYITYTNGVCEIAQVRLLNT